MAVSFFFIKRLWIASNFLLRFDKVIEFFFLLPRKHSLRTINFYTLGFGINFYYYYFFQFWNTKQRDSTLCLILLLFCFHQHLFDQSKNVANWFILFYFFAFCNVVCLDSSCNHTVVSLALICSFNRMRKHLKLEEVKSAEVTEDTVKAVAQALKDSALVRVSEDGWFLFLCMCLVLLKRWFYSGNIKFCICFRN